MSSSFDIRMTGLNELRADLGSAITKAPVQTRQAVEVTSRKVKDSMRARAAEIGPHAKAYPNSISYDILYANAVSVRSEIGPDKDKPQGALGNLLNFGSVHNPPHEHVGAALDENEADFERGLDLAMASILW